MKSESLECSSFRESSLLAMNHKATGKATHTRVGHPSLRLQCCVLRLPWDSPSDVNVDEDEQVTAHGPTKLKVVTRLRVVVDRVEQYVV